MSNLLVADEGGERKNMENKNVLSIHVPHSQIEVKEVPTIRLSAEQIEEIHADEYSLNVFYLIRIQPFFLDEIVTQLPEPETNKAKLVLERFQKAGLAKYTEDGKYFSCYPEGYINYSDYRYDCDLEAKKDSKIFELIKSFTGVKEYWEDKTYFSIDAFFTEEQSKELIKMFVEIKNKAKFYADENSKKKEINGLKFRKIKFYDMYFALALVLCTTLMSFSNLGFAGGNDPTGGKNKFMPDIDLTSTTMFEKLSGGGNDPDGRSLPNDGGIRGGGGHDPTTTKLHEDLMNSLNGCHLIGEYFCDSIIEGIQTLQDSADSQGE